MRQRTGDLDRKRIIEILLPPVIVFLVNSAVYWGAPRLTDTGEYHNLSLALDAKIPLIPAFILVVLRPFLHCDFRIALHAMVLLVGLLFVMDFKLKKPGNKTLSALVGVVAVAVVWTLRRRFM